MSKYIPLKVIVSLLPALIFFQNWGWMTGNKMLGTAFLVLWLSMIWFLLHLEDRHEILHKVFRASEIGCFLLPISALILTFVVGSMAVNSSDSGAAQAGAAIGTAIGGMFAVGIGFIFGLFGGIIFHIISNRFSKNMQETEVSDRANFLVKHKVVTIITALVILLIVAVSRTSDTASSAQEMDTVPPASTSERIPQAQETSVQAEAKFAPPAQVVAGPSPVEVVKTGVSKDILDNPVADVTIKNTTDKEIDAIKLRLFAFNTFGELVKGFLEDHMNGIAQKPIPPGASKEFSWQMTFYEGVSSVKAEVYQVHFTDGTSWGEE